MVKARIFTVDDEPGIRKYLQANLEDDGHEVDAAVEGSEALTVVEMELPDLVILDIVMPGMDESRVRRRIRELAQTPVIMVSARVGEENKLRSLDLSADDHVTKPVRAQELHARVRVVFRRSKTASALPAPPSFRSGDIIVNFAERRVTVGDSEVKLTPTEYSLLMELVLNANKVLTHAQLLNRVWGPEHSEKTEYLRVFVRRLRAKLEREPAIPKHIINVPGVGYKFVAAP
ncbi:MAG: response regulator transcription factor [Dehalococcoidia bacterium]